MKENLWPTVATYLAYCVDKELWKAIEYLREQVRVLKEQQEKDKRILLDNLQRTRLAANAKRLTRELLEATTVLFTPETVLGWYRRLIARKYDGSKNRKTPGRPRISQEVIDRKRPAEYTHESRTNMTQRIGEQVDNRGESSDARLVKSGSKMLARPLRRSFGNQFAVGGCRTEVVGFADPAAGCHTGTRKDRRRSRSLSNGKCRAIIMEPARVDLSFRLRQAEGGRIDSDIRDGISSTAQGGCRP